MTTLLSKVFGTYLGIEFKEDSIVITYLKNSFSGITLLSSGTFPLKFEDAVSDEILEYITRHGINVNKVFVSIPDRWAIIKFIDIPSMKGRSKEMLANLMKFEIERHIPFEIDDVVYDFLVTDKNDMRNSVVFVAVQKKKIDFIKEYLGKLSIQPHAITVASFAVLNSIELSTVAIGGWQDIIGIVRKSDVLGKKGETNISIYMDKAHANVSIIRDGLCTHMRSFIAGRDRPLEAVFVEISRYLAEVQASLLLEQFNKLMLAGDASLTGIVTDELKEKIGVDAGSISRAEKFSGKLKGADINVLSASIGACFAGLGIGTYNINLMPHKTDYEIRKIAPLTTKIFLVVILILLLGIFSTEAVKQKRYIGMIEETIKGREPEIRAIQILLSDINSIKEQSDLMDSIEKSELALEVLSELAGIIPADAWVTNLNYKGININDKKDTGGELVISGLAASSSSLISILEDSPFFEKVEFVGPIKKTQDKEQFKVSAKIVRPSERGSETK